MYRYDTVAEACADHGIKAYMDSNEGIFPQCRVCDDDDDDGDAGIGGGGGAGIGNYKCGDDEIGGGSEECTKCGPGEVPNEAGTECVACEHGEFEAGECASLCSNAELDSAAALSLGGIPREPWERLESYTCDSAGHMHIKWLGSSQNAREVCRIEITNAPKASSAYGHSHPFFVWDRDKGIVCDGTPFRTEKEIDDWNKDDGDGAKFSPGDKRNAKSVGKPMYLVVPKRDKVKVYRKTGRTGFWGGDKWDVEMVQ